MKRTLLKHSTIALCISLLLASGFAAAGPRSWAPGSLELKKVFSLETYKNPKNLALLTGFLTLVRLLGKEPNPDRLTVKKAIKGFHPKNILEYPIHLLSCIDDIVIGFPGRRKNRHIVVINGKPINPYAPYGILGTTFSHIAGTTEGLKTLKNFREILLYFKHALNKDFA